MHKVAVFASVIFLGKLTVSVKLDRFGTEQLIAYNSPLCLWIWF